MKKKYPENRRELNLSEKIRAADFSEYMDKYELKAEEVGNWIGKSVFSVYSYRRARRPMPAGEYVAFLRALRAYLRRKKIDVPKELLGV